MNYRCPGCLQSHDAPDGTAMVECPSCGRYVEAGTSGTRRPRGRALLLGAAAGGALGLLILAGACPLLYRSFGAPSPSGEGERWTHKEFLEHLDGRGVRYEVTARGGVAGGMIPPFVDLLVDGRYEVDVSIHPDAKAARDTAGAWGRGDECFAWGRFVVKGRGEGVAVIRRAVIRP